jgi:Protein of unknown function (DUF3575)
MLIIKHVKLVFLLFSLTSKMLLIMKTNRFFAILSIFCFAMFAQKVNAQVDVTASPVRLLWGSFNAGADFGIKENFSIEANIGYNTGTILEKFGIDDFKAVPVNLIGKYYFNPKQGSDGFYAGGFLRFVSRDLQATATIDSLETQEISYNAKRLGLGFGLGYKIVSQKGFVFDIGTGLGRTIFQDNNLETTNENVDTPNWNKTLFYTRIGIGYRFGGGKREG